VTTFTAAVLGSALAAVLLAAALVAVLRHWRARRALLSMSRLLTDGAHDRVLSHPAPAKAYRPLVDRVRATSALLTGRNELALSLLDEGNGADAHPEAPRRDATQPRRGGSPRTGRSTARGESLDTHLRGGALLAMGRYAEAAAVLGDDPQDALARHQRAQLAIEVGDDATALRLLQDPHTDRVEEAGRLRILGDLHIRRGRLPQGEALVREARATYLASRLTAKEVDTGYCHHHLGEVGIARGDIDGAVAQFTTALALLAARPDNAPGHAMVHARLAEAYALAGQPELARDHLREALRRSQLVGSPSLSALVERSHGLVALHLGEVDEAGRHLTAALAAHHALGELPAVELVAELLDDLDTSL
jgi:tetratricopeptide (TPR) repeat protein